MPSIRPVTELMVMSIIGIMTTFYESSNQSMNDNIRDVWATEVRDSTIVKESVRKSIMLAIALARGLTVHIYIASYILMIYPILFERGLTLLLLWMLLCAVRSIIVNLVALVTGCAICSNHIDLKPVCFEFGATKAIELACSVYMWLSVNDFHVRLRTKRRSFIARRMLVKTTQISDSELSLMSSDISYMDFDGDLADSSEEALMARSAVDWLTKTVFGTKGANRLLQVDSMKVHRFLNMSPEELKELQNRIKEKLYEDVEVKEGEQEQPLMKEEMGTDVQSLIEIDSESLYGPEENYDDLRGISSKPSSMKLAVGLKTTKQSDSGMKLDNNLTTQSTGSQTKEPSRKLQERLFTEEMSPIDPSMSPVSSSFDPGRKPPKATGGLTFSKDVEMGSPGRSDINKSNSKEKSNKREKSNLKRKSGLKDKAVSKDKLSSEDKSNSKDSSNLKGKSNSKDNRPSEEQLKVDSTSPVRGIMINRDDDSRREAKDDKEKKTVALKQKQ